MRQYELDMPERNILRRTKDGLGALIGSCPTACSTVQYLVQEELKRLKDAGTVPDVLRVVYQAIETVYQGSYLYRITSDCAIDPVKHLTNDYSDMLNVLAVLEQENPGTEYICTTWNANKNMYVKV